MWVGVTGTVVMAADTVVGESSHGTVAIKVCVARAFVWSCVATRARASSLLGDER